MFFMLFEFFLRLGGSRVVRTSDESVGGMPLATAVNLNRCCRLQQPITYD
jgi:hypothetical protein